MTYVDPHLAQKISAYADSLAMSVRTGSEVAGDLRAILDGTYDPEHPIRRRPQGLDRCDAINGVHSDPHRGCILRGQR